ncbi:hypothetical protein [Cytobacillus firmus]|uniref:hypothetical protein n=1 Tax=Cytobacillus firmus TaxID=1399 RepID=UPI0018CDECCB|nr:hypothetical protein [Cytobacillus firmus]MBG9585559.1 hypothetical protein [Cytobacillus firmus]MBG9585616.1 hypothetical protein [Cytobacillus firmus]MBG9586923.1 hypothetical protein [Cytobacillus firmus]MBG9587417.1 hypothetical protein [Cytobacillus firmus]
MNRGNRIYFDQDGDIILQTGEMTGDVIPHKSITKVDFLDLEYGEIDLSKHKIVKIDVSTKKPFLENIVVPLTPEQQRIIELENELLLASGVI